MPSSSAHHRRYRSRSRSPTSSSYRDSTRHRSPNSYRSNRHESPHSKHPNRPTASRPAALPHGCSPLSRHDFDAYEPLFALYLDVQKQLVMEDLDEREVKGRWKRFVSKWNRGELAEGWYLPSTMQRAVDAWAEAGASQDVGGARRASPEYGTARSTSRPGRDDGVGGDSDDDEDEDEFGPAPAEGQWENRRAGPTVPRMQDLELRDEITAEEAANRRADLRHERKQERRQQAERLEELAPRADPGSRERKLEKKREATATMRSFREAKSPGAQEEVGEGDLMGEDGIEGYKARKKEAERKKNEREIQREEMLRARAAEREERLAKVREKETRTVEMLKALAKQRFG